MRSHSLRAIIIKITLSKLSHTLEPRESVMVDGQPLVGQKRLHSGAFKAADITHRFGAMSDFKKYLGVTSK